MITKAKGLREAGIQTFYLSYPMTDDRDGAIAIKMQDLENWLEGAGFTVLNPENLFSQTDHILHLQKTEPRYRDYMAFDLMSLCYKADAIILADEWKQSRGCRCEAFTAYTCDIMMLDERLTRLAPSVVMYECFQPAK